MMYNVYTMYRQNNIATGLARSLLTASCSYKLSPKHEHERERRGHSTPATTNDVAHEWKSYALIYSYLSKYIYIDITSNIYI